MLTPVTLFIVSRVIVDSQREIVKGELVTTNQRILIWSQMMTILHQCNMKGFRQNMLLDYCMGFKNLLSLSCQPINTLLWMNLTNLLLMLPRGIKLVLLRIVIEYFLSKIVKMAKVLLRYNIMIQYKIIDIAIIDR